MAFANSNVIKLYDIEAHFPPPSWTTSNDQLAKSEVKRKQKTDSLAIEFIPKGQSFDSWTAMSAIYTIDLPERDIDWFLRRTVEIYNKGCSSENVTVDTVQDNITQKLIVIYCQKFKDDIPEYEIESGVGEIAVIHLENAGNTFVKNYHAWRGQNFDRNAPETWPTTNANIEKSITALKEAKLVPH